MNDKPAQTKLSTHRSSFRLHRSRARTPWFDSAFQRDYLDRYSHRSDALARAEFPFIRRALGLRRGMRILDLCCGAGRHARTLAAAGFTVAGVDRSLDLLHAAERIPHAKAQRRKEQKEGGGRKEAARSAGKIEYVRADMRRLPFPAESFDGGVNLFTSFGYFASDRANERALVEAARVLKPGAPFLMDFLNLAAALRNLVPCSEQIVNGATLKERRWFDRRTRRLNKSIRVCEAGRERTLRESVRAYTPHELAALLKKAGFVVERRYGDLKGAPFNARTSPRCVLLARKT